MCKCCPSHNIMNPNATLWKIRLSDGAPIWHTDRTVGKNFGTSGFNGFTKAVVKDDDGLLYEAGIAALAGGSVQAVACIEDRGASYRTRWFSVDSPSTGVSPNYSAMTHLSSGKLITCTYDQTFAVVSGWQRYDAATGALEAGKTISSPTFEGTYSFGYSRTNSNRILSTPSGGFVCVFSPSVRDASLTVTHGGGGVSAANSTYLCPHGDSHFIISSSLQATIYKRDDLSTVATVSGSYQQSHSDGSEVLFFTGAGLSNIALTNSSLSTIWTAAVAGGAGVTFHEPHVGETGYFVAYSLNSSTAQQVAKYDHAGTLLWTTSLGRAGQVQHLEERDGVLYASGFWTELVTLRNKHVAALDAATGAVRWNRGLISPTDTPGGLEWVWGDDCLYLPCGGVVQVN